MSSNPARKALAALVLGALVTLAPAALAGHLHGVVTETSNAPIPGTLVEVFAGATKVGEATSIADGTYAVDVGDGTYTLVATPPAGSYYNGATIPNVAVAGDTRRDIVLALPEFVLSWSVLRDDGRVVPGTVTVTVSGPSGTTSKTASAQGALADVTLKPGTYTVKVAQTANLSVNDDGLSGTANEVVATNFTISGAAFDLTADTQLDIRLPLVDATFVAKDVRGVEHARVAINRTASADFGGTTPLAGGSGLAFTSATGDFAITSTGADGHATVAVIPTAGPLEVKATPQVADHLVAKKFGGLALTSDATVDFVLPDQAHLTGRVAIDHGGTLTPYGVNADVLLAGTDAYGNSNARTISCAADGTFDAWVNPQTGLKLTLDVNSAAFSRDDDGNAATTAEQWRASLDLGPATLDLLGDASYDFDVPAVAATFVVVDPDGAEVPRSAIAAGGWTPVLPMTVGGLAFAAGATSFQVLSSGSDGRATVLVPATPSGTTLAVTATPPGNVGLIAATVSGLAWPTDVTHTITLGGKVALSGTLLRAGSNTPIHSAQVKIAGGPTVIGAPITPAADGSFSVLVEPGTYTVQLLTVTGTNDDETYDEDGNPATSPAAMRNADFLTDPATLVVSGPTNLDLRVPLPTVCFHAHDPHAQPLASVTVTQATYDADDFTTAGLTFTGFTGTFRARTGASGTTCLDVPAMAGDVAANKNLTYVRGGYLGGTLTTQVYPSAGTSVDLTLTKLPSLSGTVLFSNGAPPPSGMYIRVVEDNAQVSLAADGSFSFSSLSAGAKHFILADTTSLHLRQSELGDTGGATTDINLTSTDTLTLALEQVATLDLEIPVVTHSLTFYHGDGTPYLGASSFSMPVYDVPSFTTGGLTFGGTAQHVSVRTGTDETMSWLAPLGAPGSSIHFSATPSGSATRTIDTTYPADGGFVVFVSDGILTATVAESSGVPLGLVSTSDLAVQWTRSNTDGANVPARWSSTVDADGATTTATPDGDYRPHVKAAAHYTEGGTGAARWAKSALETTASAYPTTVAGDTATTLTLNTRRLLVTVQNQFGSPVAGVTVSVSQYVGASATLGGVAWGDLTGSATAALGSEGQVTLVLPQTKANQQLSLRVTPLASSGYLPVTIKKDLLTDTAVTVVLTTACEPGTPGCDILCLADADCDDGLFCNGAEACDPATGCAAGPAPIVDDGVACTVDSCDETLDAVVHAASDAACDNGLFCDGAETCDPATGCAAGPAPIVDDGVACTVDRCDETLDAVVHAASDAACADNDLCTTDHCDATLGCEHAAFVPQTVSCGAGACATTSSQTACDPATGAITDGCDAAIPEVPVEVCDGQDNDCDGVVDNGFDTDCGPSGVVFYATVTDENGEPVGTVRCFEDGDAVRCDTREDDPTVLDIHPGLVCPAQ